jgi:hypothetical protein
MGHLYLFESSLCLTLVASSSTSGQEFSLDTDTKGDAAANTIIARCNTRTAHSVSSYAP